MTIVHLLGMLNEVSFCPGPATEYGIQDHTQMLSRLDKDTQYFHQGALHKTNISNVVSHQGVAVCIQLLEDEIKNILHVKINLQVVIKLVTMNSHNCTKSKAVLILVRYEDKIKAQRRIEYP